MVNLHKSEIDPFKTQFFFIRKHSGTKLNQFQPMVLAKKTCLYKKHSGTNLDQYGS